MTQGRLRGRSVLVVGASAGLGRAVALAAAAEGASLTLAARRQPELDAVAERVAGDVATVRCDVLDDADCRRAVDVTVESWGGLDVLFYSAGFSVLGPIAETSPEEWERIFHINTIGAARTTAWAAPALRKSHGRAIYVSSQAASVLKIGLIPYAASKRALEAIVDGYRLEEPEIAFTTLVVASTGSTEFTASWDPDTQARYNELWKERGLLTKGAFATEEAFADLVMSVLTADIAVPQMSVGPFPF